MSLMTVHASARVSQLTAVCVLSLFAAGCGGGGGDDGSPAPEPPPAAPAPPEPRIQFSIAAAALDLDTSQGDEIPMAITGTWSATDLPAGSSVYLAVADTSSRFQMPAAQLATAGSPFTFNIKTSGAIEAGTYNGAIQIRACRDSACAQTYSGTNNSVNYELSVSRVPDWETHQRDSGHTGYVPLWLDATRFANAWEWRRPPDSEPIGGINEVVAANGIVYVSKDVWHGEGAVIALNDDDGTEAWRVSLGVVPTLGPPAVKGDKVFVATAGHADTFLWTFDAITGDFGYKSPFEGQWPNIWSPTVFGDRVYVGGGHNGGAYSFSTDDGARTWQYSAGGVWDKFTPAVDSDRVYHYDGGMLHVIDKATGAAAHTITDPFGGYNNYSYHGSPILGSRHNVVAFARGAFSGRASSNVEQYEQRVLSSFDVSSNMRYEWSTSYAYLTQPALAHGLIFAARNQPMSLDAIDETTGDIVWSWVPPEGHNDFSFHRNIVVTRNMLFVSTDASVYALDLETRAVRWRYPAPGMLAISPNRTLYIATGATASDGRLVAVKLQ